MLIKAFFVAVRHGWTAGELSINYDIPLHSLHDPDRLQSIETNTELGDMVTKSVPLSQVSLSFCVRSKLSVVMPIQRVLPQHSTVRHRTDSTARPGSMLIPLMTRHPTLTPYQWRITPWAALLARHIGRIESVVAHW